MPGNVAGSGACKPPICKPWSPLGGKATVSTPQNDSLSLPHAVLAGAGWHPMASSAATELMGMREVKPCLQGTPIPVGSGWAGALGSPLRLWVLIAQPRGIPQFRFSRDG